MLFTIPSFIYTGRYYVDFQQIISNYTAFNTSWYGEGWFLFPFICLSLLSPWIFKLTDRYKVRWILPISFLLGTCTSFIISRYGAQYLYKNHWLYNPFLILHLAPSFIFGAMLQRTGFIHKMRRPRCRRYFRKFLPRGSFCRRNRLLLQGCSVHDFFPECRQILRPRRPFRCNWTIWIRFLSCRNTY